MFKTRLISGIILVIVLIATVGTGGNVLFGLLAVVSLIGLTELYKVIEVQNKLLGFAGYLATVAYYVLLYTGNLQYMTLFTIVFLVLVMAVYVFTFPNYRSEQVMTVFFGVFFALAVNQWAGAQAGVLEYAIICGVGGMISQVGDLAASAIKRNHEIKDYGKLIPGHGGILDRFDSVIFTAPIIYYLTMALAGNL